MATYNQIGYGSKGSTVTELQKLLNQNGYTLDTDGIFGSNTQAAVKDYQQKNGLTVDGIVGTNTWGALTKASTTTPSTQSTPTETPTQTEPKTPEFEYGDYSPSDTVSQAEALLQQQIAQKPGEYQSTWQDQLNDTLQKILNREPFSYDMNGDALYQQYKDQYTTQGKMAMMDTMGQAAALTGGYGNSYAQNAGQQAYQAYLQQLNEVVPELYGMALDQYNQEGQNLYNQATLMAQQEDRDYGRYMDGLNAWLTERDYLAGRYDNERDYDYGKWADGRDFAYGQYMDNLNYEYQTGRDAVADQQWQAQFDEAKRQFDISASKSSGGGGGSGGSGGSGGGGGKTYSAPEGWDTARIKAFQKSAGLTEDGIWGPKTQAAYENSTQDFDKPTYDSIVNDLNTFIKNGASKSEISNYLRAELNAGTITQTEYNQLKEQYVPRGYTY